MGRLLLPSWFNPWGWVAIIAAVTLIIVLLIIAIAWLLCKKYQKRRANAAVGKAPKRQPASPKNNTPTVREEAAPKRQQPAPAPVQPVRQAAPAQPVRQPAPAPAQPARQTAPTAQAAKPAPKPQPQIQSKPAEKPAAAQNKETKMEENKAPSTEGRAASTTKTYHISKRKEDNRWQVKAAGAAKAIKLFFTQAEAIDFAKKLAGNQDANIMIHKEDGSFRRLTYK
ncbi:MAG: DUF2188 domain-containing protein [Clostridia bacterium]|nr:DUF2188 domain-containing protein [Clostridia bacterium]